MRRRVVAASRLRRRLTIAFVLVAGVAAAGLAAGSFVLVRSSRLDDSLDRAEQETRRNLTLAAVRDIPVSGGPRALQDLATSFQRERGVRTLLIVDGETYASDRSIRFAPSADLMRVVERGEIGYRRVTLSGSSYLAVGARAPDPDTAAELYFLFSEERLQRDLGQLRNVLLIGVAVVVLLSGLVGRTVARRTLQPVARASDAARAMAEGILDTRLPVSGRDEFGAWAASFNEMAAALEGKISALTEAQARERRFTADVAHELRTPLTALVGEASLLKEHLEAMPEEARRPAELLVADVARLRRLVEELMEISRMDSGIAAVQAERVDVASLVRTIVSARGWEGMVRVETRDVVLHTDPRRLERVVVNLIGNALDHGVRGVSVRVGRDGAGAFVEVSDRGPGIPPEHLPHLFDRFYKADPSRASGGSGLGLAIALENARLLGGDIRVWSEMGLGTSFTLRLPVTEPLPPGEERVSYQGHDGA